MKNLPGNPVSVRAILVLRTAESNGFKNSPSAGVGVAISSTPFEAKLPEDTPDARREYVDNLLKQGTHDTSMRIVWLE